MNSDELEKAVHLIKACVVRGGFAAALETRDNYRNVWSRDGCVVGIASLTLGNQYLISAFEENVRTLASHQGRNGEIPSNVNLAQSKVSYGGPVGRVDASIWFIIGTCIYSRMTQNDKLVIDLWKSLERTVNLLSSWEFNLGGLLYVPFSGDWADEYILSGYLLYDQVLRLWAMRELAAVAKRLDKDAQQAIDKAEQIEKILNRRFLPSSDRPYFLAGYNPGETHPQFDAFGNALCCLLDVGTRKDRITSLSYAARCSEYNLVPAFHPIIEDGDPKYQALIAAANEAGKVEPRNKPGQYHNGGLWPFINGFWVLAAKKLDDQVQANRWTKGIIAANSLNGDAYFEFRDSRTGKPGGTKGQAWSAAGYILSQAEPSILFVE